MTDTQPTQGDGASVSLSEGRQFEPQRGQTILQLYQNYKHMLCIFLIFILNVIHSSSSVAKNKEELVHIPIRPILAIEHFEFQF